MIKLTTAIERGGLKECAKKLESPDPACIYKQNCIWCTPKPKGEKLKKKIECIFCQGYMKQANLVATVCFAILRIVPSNI